MPVKGHPSRGSKLRSPKEANPFASAVGTLLLLGLGTVTFLFGRRAIVAEYFEYENRFGSNITIGSLGFSDRHEGFRILEGPEAIYWGIAFCALGVMFAFWASGIALSFLAHKKSDPKQPLQTSTAGRYSTWLSFICLLVAILCLFPPWRLGSALFYGVAALIVWTFVVSIRQNRSELPKKVIPGIIIAAVFAGSLHLGSLCADIVLALGAMLFSGIHVLMLAPELMKRRPGEKEVVPSLNFEE